MIFMMTMNMTLEIQSSTMVSNERAGQIENLTCGLQKKTERRHKLVLMKNIKPTRSPRQQVMMFSTNCTKIQGVEPRWPHQLGPWSWTTL